MNKIQIGNTLWQFDYGLINGKHPYTWIQQDVKDGSRITVGKRIKRSEVELVVEGYIAGLKDGLKHANTIQTRN